MERLRKFFIDACIVIALGIAFVAAAEIALRLISYVKAPKIPDQGYQIVQRQSWGSQYIADERLIRRTYRHYTVFRESELVSPTINIDGEGRRRVPGSCEHPAATLVMAFGGSTMFGYGVPDEHTIPAYLAQAFATAGHCARIVNHGSASWQSTQSLIELLQLTKRGVPVPAVVLFYDGINEIEVVTKGGRPGDVDPQAERLLRFALQGGTTGDAIGRLSALVRSLQSRFGPLPPSYIAPREVTATSSQIAEIYAQNVRAVDDLASSHGFAAYFVLQPHPVIGEKHTSAMEQEMLHHRAIERPGEAEFIRSVYLAIRRHPYLAAHSRFLDASNLFAGRSEELYADTEHLLPNGNRMVANLLIQHIGITLPQRTE